MTFDRILEDGRLWAVRYDGRDDNCFVELLDSWFDMQWLASFFKDNLDDLKSYFHITDVYEAVMETVEEASRLECLMLDISPDANLDMLFKHLENSRFSEMWLSKEKAKGDGSYRHPSWLRIYAIRVEKGVYLVTGSLVVEQIFAVPGIGRAFVNSITGRDYPLVMGTTIVLAALIVIMNLVGDILYKVVDPRISLE